MLLSVKYFKLFARYLFIFYVQWRPPPSWILENDA